MGFAGSRKDDTSRSQHDRPAQMALRGTRHHQPNRPTPSLNPLQSLGSMRVRIPPRALIPSEQDFRGWRSPLLTRPSAAAHRKPSALGATWFGYLDGCCTELPVLRRIRRRATRGDPRLGEALCPCAGLELLAGLAGFRAECSPRRNRPGVWGRAGSRWRHLIRALVEGSSGASDNPRHGCVRIG